MGMAPQRSGGSLAYALTQNGLVTTADVYGVAAGALTPLGIVSAAGGAPASSMGARAVSAVPPSLRAGGAATKQPTTGLASLGAISTGLAQLPGNSSVHLIILGLLGLFALRFAIKEAE